MLALVAQVHQLIEQDRLGTMLQNLGITLPPVNTPAGFAEIQRRDIARWAEVVRRSGATVD